jgi:hypothetical protein
MEGSVKEDGADCRKMEMREKEAIIADLNSGGASIIVP